MKLYCFHSNASAMSDKLVKKAKCKDGSETKQVHVEQTK